MKSVSWFVATVVACVVCEGIVGCGATGFLKRSEWAKLNAVREEAERRVAHVKAIGKPAGELYTAAKPKYEAARTANAELLATAEKFVNKEVDQSELDRTVGEAVSMGQQFVDYVDEQTQSRAGGETTATVVLVIKTVIEQYNSWSHDQRKEALTKLRRDLKWKTWDDVPAKRLDAKVAKQVKAAAVRRHDCLEFV